jgi:hypothetical protein
MMVKSPCLLCDIFRPVHFVWFVYFSVDVLYFSNNNLKKGMCVQRPKNNNTCKKNLLGLPNVTVTVINKNQ